MIKIFRQILIAILSFLTMDASAASYYIVKAGQTFSEIAHAQFQGPIYGQNGAVEKLLALNPKIKNPNLIYVNQKIKTSTDHESSRSLSSTEASQEISPTEKNMSEAKVMEPNPKIECAPPTVPDEPTKSGVGIRIGTQFFRLNSTDPATNSSSTLISEMSPSVDLYWKLDVNDSWTTRFGYSMVSFKILQTDALSAKSLTGNTGSMMAMDFGAAYKWNNSNSTEVFLGTKEKLFLRATSASTIAVEKVITPVLGFDHSLNLYKASSVTLGSHLQLTFEQPAEGIGYKTKSGTGGLLGVSLSHQTKSVIINGEVFYNFFNQNSEITEQKGSAVGTKIGLEWRF